MPPNQKYYLYVWSGVAFSTNAAVYKKVCGLKSTLRCSCDRDLQGVDDLTHFLVFLCSKSRNKKDFYPWTDRQGHIVHEHVVRYK